ncbi:hypothetical protein NDU88_003525 [Pleurodeles waltl]|uniref:Uncharacterized protein n=1 Tax=Pleurodeles waltl TaxID=8319 RepID=A0AAV7M5M5_PLEWA|nr:hypothetical protein NDU88_003525 [Pleurodeles waltl]
MGTQWSQRRSVEEELTRVERTLLRSEREATRGPGEGALLLEARTEHYALLERLRCLNYAAHSARTHASADKTGKIPSIQGRFLQSSWCKKEAGYPQSMHHQETGEKAGRMKRYKVAVVVFATLLRFCRRPEQSAVDPLAEGEEGDAEELW